MSENQLLSIHQVYEKLKLGHIQVVMCEIFFKII